MTTDAGRAWPRDEGEPLALGLRLLDHQMVGQEEELLGNVDDVVLEERDGRLTAVALLRGPGAWANRQPGALGRWGRAVWRRLESEQDPAPVALPLDHVLSIGSAVSVDSWARSYLVGTDSLELWLRRYVVGKIPGARGGEHPFGGPLDAVSKHDDLEPSPHAHLLSRLIGAEVVSGDGARTRRVVEVRALQATPMSSRVGPLVITSLVHGPHRLGGELGYREDPRMGPLLLGSALRRWHRHDIETPWESVRIMDWAASRVHLNDRGGR